MKPINELTVPVPKGYTLIDPVLWNAHCVKFDYAGLNPIEIEKSLDVKSEETLEAIGVVKGIVEVSLPQRLVEIDGWLYDADTGELHSPVVVEGFRVDSIQRLEWVLEKVGIEESNLASIDTRPEVLHARAVLDNAEKLKGDYRRRIESLLWRFGPEVESFAREELARQKGKSKTLKTLFGAISFRAQAASLKLVEKSEAAVQYLRDVCASALRVEIDLNAFDGDDADLNRAAVLEIADSAGGAAKLTPMPSWLPKDLKDALIADPEQAQENGFLVTPACEKMKIDTGVAAQ